GRPVSAKALAVRHDLPPRHLEPMLQALVHERILKGIRGPRGGYELDRDPAQITIDSVLRAARTVEEPDLPPPAPSGMLMEVIMPALAEAEEASSAALR